MADPYRYEGLTGDELAALLDLPRVELLSTTTSTLDVAHALAGDGAPAGTLVIADEQTAGRGRTGARWTSPGSRGLWLTIIERPLESSGLDVLSLRLGLAAARALDRFASEPIRLKWPNDIFVEGRKLAGTLSEARWRQNSLEWIAIGMGVNVVPPEDVESAAGLDPGTRRIEVIEDLIPALRKAAGEAGPLAQDELDDWSARDLARGRHCTQPAHGTVKGISADGELIVALADSVARFRSGSLVLDPAS